MTTLEPVSDARTAVRRLHELYEDSCQLAREVLNSGDYQRYSDVVYPAACC